MERNNYFILLSTKSPTTTSPFWYGDSVNFDANRKASIQCFLAKNLVCSKPCDRCTSSNAFSTSPGSRKRRRIIGFSSGYCKKKTLKNLNQNTNYSESLLCVYFKNATKR